MASFQFKMTGFPAANRDAVIQLVNESTGKTVERKPFLDGTLTVTDLDDGYYQMKVVHPNLVNPIIQKRIRLFPQIAPTVVPIPIPEKLFQDSPIRDIPDADLTPVQQTAATVKEQLAPIGSKTPGEAIKSADWNLLVNGVAELASAVTQHTQHDSPRATIIRKSGKDRRSQGNIGASRAFGTRWWSCSGKSKRKPGRERSTTSSMPRKPHSPTGTVSKTGTANTGYGAGRHAFLQQTGQCRKFPAYGNQ
jgi:hypothetical protein